MNIYKLILNMFNCYDDDEYYDDEDEIIIYSENEE